MQKKILEAGEVFNAEITKIKNIDELESIRIKYLGRKGLFAQLFEEFKKLPKDEKPKFGQLLNDVKKSSQEKFDLIKNQFDGSSSQVKNYIDLSLPGRDRQIGKKHVVTQTMDEIKLFFQRLGFSVYEGPELESDYNNFEALNFPADHPARDMQDTFFVTNDFVLRTHTSPVQIRLMQNKKPPIRAIMPGKVYRNEVLTAKSHCQFHQVEGLVVDTDVTFAELKGTLVAYAKQFFGEDLKFRFRPSFFPFTEPSAEMDIWWKPEGKPAQWMEILGCGMVDPNVLENCGIDSEKYVGYAFGMGVERTALRKYGINDIRLLFDNDNRFLNQF